MANEDGSEAEDGDPGEVLAVSQLVHNLRVEFPRHRILVSTTTDTGQNLGSRRFGAENVFYFPLDFAFAFFVAAAIRKIRAIWLFVVMLGLVPAAAAMMDLPVAVSPVKAILSMPGCAAM